MVFATIEVQMLKFGLSAPLLAIPCCRQYDFRALSSAPRLFVPKMFHREKQQSTFPDIR